MQLSLLASGWNCIAHRQVLQGFPDMSKVSVHTNNKIISFILKQFLPGAGK
jgi:hypothetical protein